jgi:apolipoprotein N-acyltransferase
VTTSALSPIESQRLLTGLPLPVAIFAAVIAGWLMDLGFPDADLWPLTVVGVAMMFFAARGLTLWQALLVGLAGGLSYYGILIWWLTVYLGLIPWLGLTLLQTLFFGLGFVLLTLGWRWGSAAWSTPMGRIGFVPVLLSSLWLIREAIASVWPFGGFAWGRIAQSQSESPLVNWVAWLGTSGFSALVVWLSALAVALWQEYRLDRLSRATLAAGVLAFLVAWPSYPATITDEIRVAAVQGNADAGLFADYARGDNLRDHKAVTRQIYGTPVDVVVWPENASDIDPLRDEDARAAVDEVVLEMGAPLVVGAITKDGDKTFNSVLLWEISAGSGEGSATDQYDKIHPVPFAEYLPARDFFYPLAPDLFDMVPRDYSFGTRDTVFEVAGHTAGIAICYDIVDDAIFFQMMSEGADIILAPTNNADFGRTEQSEQQLAIARLRAIELGRSVVNISTVGTSAIITPEGEELDRLATYTEGYMIENVPTADHTTPAVSLGRSLEWGLIALGVLGLAIARPRR